MSGRWSCEKLQVGFAAVIGEAQDTTMDAEEAKLLAEIQDQGRVCRNVYANK